MNQFLATSLAAAALVLCSACNQDSNKPAASTNTTASGTGPADAPAGYLGALAKGQQSAVKTIDTTSIDKAIQLFNVDQSRNPKDLNELVEKKYLPQIPAAPYGMKLEYDSASGTVKVVKQ